MINNQKVTVVADDLGNVITQSLNPEIGYIRIEQHLRTIGLNNWVKNEKRSALIFGKIEDLQNFDFKANQELDGRIIVEESLQPFDPAKAEREMKMAGSTGVYCRVDDQPIYRRTRYSTSALDQDTLIHHTNTDEIREALALVKDLMTNTAPSETVTF
jgi:hypothetical protein